MTTSYRLTVSAAAQELFPFLPSVTWKEASFQGLLHSSFFFPNADTLSDIKVALLDAYSKGFTAGLLPRTEPIKALFFDMDATLIQQETIDELAREAGVYPQVRVITEAAMAGQLDFADALIQRVATLKGLPSKTLEKVTARLTLQIGCAELCLRAKQKGAELYLVSGGFVPVAEPFARQLHFTGFHANHLEVSQEQLTGRLFGTIVDAQEKANFVTKTCAAKGWDLRNIVAIGDGANDALMLQLTEFGIGFKPKKALWPFITMANQTGDHRALSAALWDGK